MFREVVCLGNEECLQIFEVHLRIDMLFVLLRSLTHRRIEDRWPVCEPSSVAALRILTIIEEDFVRGEGLRTSLPTGWNAVLLLFLQVPRADGILINHRPDASPSVCQ